MIRRTQARTIRLIKQKLEKEDINVIYTDEPGSSRSGPGDTARINLVFEHLYDKTPDLVATSSDKTLLIIEVDDTFKDHLPAKYEEYASREDELLALISDILDTELHTLEFGFGTIRKSMPEISVPYDCFHKFYLPDVDTVIHRTTNDIQ